MMPNIKAPRASSCEMSLALAGVVKASVAARVAASILFNMVNLLFCGACLSDGANKEDIQKQGCVIA